MHSLVDKNMHDMSNIRHHKELHPTRVQSDNVTWSSSCHGYLYEGRTESHEQLFLHANWEQQMKESAVVDGTSCCVILECLV